MTVLDGYDSRNHCPWCRCISINFSEINQVARISTTICTKNIRKRGNHSIENFFFVLQVSNLTKWKVILARNGFLCKLRRLDIYSYHVKTLTTKLSNIQISIISFSFSSNTVLYCNITLDNIVLFSFQKSVDIYVKIFHHHIGTCVSLATLYTMLSKKIQWVLLLKQDYLF